MPSPSTTPFVGSKRIESSSRMVSGSKVPSISVGKGNNISAIPPSSPDGRK
jgi:hypothetical protein